MGTSKRFGIAAATLSLGLFVAVTEPIQAEQMRSEVRPESEHTVPATVQDIESVEVRHAASGKASIRILGEGKNAFLGLLRMQGGAKVPEHQDQDEEYIHILQGTGTMFIDDKPYKVKPGTSVFMPKNARVRFQNGPDELMALQVFAGPGSAAKYDAWTTRK